MPQGPINYVEMGTGLYDAISASGNRIWLENGVMYGDDATAVQAIIDAYDPLLAVLTTIQTKKWQTIEGGHTTAAGIALQTDTNTISLITGLYANALANPSASFSFKDRNDAFQVLTSAQVTELFLDLSAWVQLSFSNEHALTIAASALTTAAEKLAFDTGVGWPPNS